MNQQVEDTSAIWTEKKLRETFCHSSDVQILSIQLDQHASSNIILAYGEGLCDTRLIGEVVLPELNKLNGSNSFAAMKNEHVYGALPLISLEGYDSPEQLAEWVFQGDLLVLLPETGSLYKLNICNRPQRTPEESSIEISIKGPRDGFVEDIITNVALVRKRLRSNSLCYETSTLGRRTKTRVGLLYIQDIASQSVLTDVKKRLASIDVDGVYSIGQLEEMLADSKYSLLPLFDTTGRPDFIVSCLLAGRFAIILDGNPIVLVGPATLSLLLKSPEDSYFNFYYVSLARAIRFLSFFLTLLLPGIWAALTAFHQDQIPFRLLATITVGRLGLPFSPQMELLLLLVLLEIFREAGLRLPSSIGQTLTVIGGLIIGDASIRAGLVSPSVVVVGAVTAVAGATLVNQSLSSAVSVLRICIFLIASILGVYGLLLGIILFFAYLSRLRSFGVPYMTPLSPPHFKEMFKSFLKIPWGKMKSRPQELATTDPTSQEDDVK
ncbi:MAG: spore gernimation protein GerA [Paenibacillus sp.]|nr:spore gernimation protein GerA [Paenibacillus sp.]